MGPPSSRAAHGEEESKEIGRDAERVVDRGRIEIDVSVDPLFFDQCQSRCAIRGLYGRAGFASFVNKCSTLCSEKGISRWKMREEANE